MKAEHDLSYISRLSARRSPAQSLLRVHAYNMATPCRARYLAKVTCLLPVKVMQSSRCYALLRRLTQPCFEDFGNSPIARRAWAGDIGTNTLVMENRK